MSKRFARLTVVAAILGSTLALAGPASAATGPDLGNLGVNLTAVDIATGSVNATCSFAPTVLIGPGGGLKFAVDGTAASTQPATTIGTNINCVVKTSFGTWGGASLGLPGPAAAAAGVSDEIPTAKIAGLRVCAYGTAFVQGGVTLASTPSPGC